MTTLAIKWQHSFLLIAQSANANYELRTANWPKGKYVNK